MQYVIKNIYKPVLFSIDLVGSLFFFWTKLFSAPTDHKSILVIRLDHAGDMVMTLPVFASLRNCFPHSKISVLCRSFLKDFVSADKNVDAVIALDVPWFSRGYSVGWLKTLFFLLSLRDKFDLVVELHGDPRNILAAFLTGGFRIGYGIRGFGFLLNKIVEFSSEKVHMIKQNLRVIEEIGCLGSEKVLLPSLISASNKMKKLLSKNQIKKYVIIHPGAARHEKLWLNENWAAVIDKIINKHTMHVVVTGIGDEHSLADDIINRVSEENKKYVLNACRLCDSLFESAALIKSSELLVSVDTVAVHFAHALKVPLVALYGSTDPLVWGYADKNSVPVYKNLSDNCGSDCRNESHRMSMMEEISVDDVVSAVEKLL